MKRTLSVTGTFRTRHRWFISLAAELRWRGRKTCLLPLDAGS